MYFSSDLSCFDGLDVMTLKMDMKVYFVSVSVMESYVFHAWEVPVYLFLKS